MRFLTLVLLAALVAFSPLSHAYEDASCLGADCGGGGGSSDHTASSTFALLGTAPCNAAEGQLCELTDSASCTADDAGTGAVCIYNGTAWEPLLRTAKATTDGDVDLIQCTGAATPEARCVAAGDIILAANSTLEIPTSQITNFGEADDYSTMYMRYYESTSTADPNGSIECPTGNEGRFVVLQKPTAFRSVVEWTCTEDGTAGLVDASGRFKPTKILDSADGFIVRDEFLGANSTTQWGALEWDDTQTGSGTTTPNKTPIGTRAGQVHIVVNAASQAINIRAGVAAINGVITGTEFFEYAIHLTDMGDTGTRDYTFSVGVCNLFTGAACDDGLLIQYDRAAYGDDNWRVVPTVNGSGTLVDTGIAVTADVWHTLALRGNGDNTWSAIIDGVVVATTATWAPTPTDVAVPIVMMVSGAGATATSHVYLDFFEMYQIGRD